MGEQVLVGVIIALVSAVLGASLASLHFGSKLSSANEVTTRALGAITSRVEVVVSELSSVTKDVDAFLPLAASVARLEERLDRAEKDVQNLYDKLRGKE